MKTPAHLVPRAPAQSWRYALWIAAAVWLVWGSSLGAGVLSDDFLYLQWARQGLGELMLRLTTHSYPQTLRPLPGLLWWLLVGTGVTAPGLHVLSLLVHAVNAALVSVIVRRLGGAPESALTGGLLFAVFPLHAEAVAWASSLFDLTAALFVLLALSRLARPGGSAAVPAGLQAAALLCKESPLTAPMAAPLVLQRRVDRGYLAMMAVSLIYLPIRWALLGGPGGYVDSGGASLLFFVNPTSIAREVFLRLPRRLLAAIKAPGDLEPWLVLASLALLAALWSVTGLRRHPRRVAAVGAAFLLTLLPVLPVFAVDAYHEGSRLLYLPVAMACVGLAPTLDLSRRRARGAVLALLAFWAVAGALNATSWTAAHDLAERTLHAMGDVAPTLPGGATVLVDAADSVDGAYVFRNGLAAAAALRGLRQDVHWVRGTSAQMGPAAAARLQRDLFVVEPRASGGVADRTAVEARLWAKPWQESKVQILPPPHGETAIPPGTRAVQVRQTCAAEVVEGTLFWKRTGEAFTLARSHRFRLGPGKPTPVRLPVALPDAPRWLRLDLDRPLPTDCAVELAAVTTAPP